MSQTKSMLCVIEHHCVWSHSYVPTPGYITCTRVQTMSICPNLYNITLEAPGTQLPAMLLCGFFWRSNRNHYYYLFLVLVMRPLPTSISMYVRVPTEIQDINALPGTIIPTTVPWWFLFQKTFLFWHKKWRQFGNNVLSCFYFINISIHQDPKNNCRVPFKIFFLRASRLSRSASIRVHPEVL